MAGVDLERIENKLNVASLGATEVFQMGGIQIKDVSQVFELSKLMAMSGAAVPSYLRGNPGACFACCSKALRFGFDPWEMAQHSYVMVKREKVDDRWVSVETVAYESAVIRAIIQAHAKITGHISYEFRGDGDDMICIARCSPPGAPEIVHESQSLGKMKAARGRNDDGKIKGSPLWDTKPRVQLAYDTGRDLCRVYFPAVLLGWRDKDEFDENVITNPPANPPASLEPPRGAGLGGRLRKAADSKGFNADTIGKTIDETVAKTAEKPAEAVAKTEPAKETAGSQGPAQAAPDSGPSTPVDAPIDPSPVVDSAPAHVEKSGAADPISSGGESPPAPAPEEITQASGALGTNGAPAPEPVSAVDPDSVGDAPSIAADYPAWVRANVAHMSSKSAIDKWWKSDAERKLRNALPNLTQELLDESHAAAKARVAELKGE